MLSLLIPIFFVLLLAAELFYTRQPPYITPACEDNAWEYDYR